MKKTSIIVKEKNIYDINILIVNTAYIKSVTGKSGLLNIKTNQIIGNMDYYDTIYSENEQFYYQAKKIQEGETEKDSTPRKTLRIYDALTETMIADGWEIVEVFKNCYSVVALRSPIDGKIHLFDSFAYRKSADIFDMALDSVEELCSARYGIYTTVTKTCFVVTMNGKKGLYCNDYSNSPSNMVAPIEFDDIEKMPNIIVYTKGNEKYFVCDGDKGKTSGLFETISIDEKDKNIAYCRKGNTTYVYDTYSQELLLKTDSDEIKYVKKDLISSDNKNGEYFFILSKNGKWGLISSFINDKIRRSSNPEARVTTLLEPNYDEIEYNYGAFYLEKDKKTGIFLGNSERNQVIEPQYDKVENHGGGFYALYTGEFCDIGSVNPYISYQPSITNCQISLNLKRGLIYKKGDLYGLLWIDDNSRNIILPAEYDAIHCVGEYYFVLEKDGKNGVFHLGEMIIPASYEDIKLGGHYSKYEDLENAKIVYFALKKGEKEYELAKRANNHYSSSNKECPVEFVSNHTFEQIDFLKDVMVLKDSSYTYVYSYEEKLLKTFPAGTEVVPSEKPCDEYDRKHNHKEYFYWIDGACYYYKNGKFEEVFSEERNFYVTTYETDTDAFEVKSSDKQEHDAFCEYIDAKEDAFAVQHLAALSTNATGLKEKYPTLVLRRIEKNQNPNQTS